MPNELRNFLALTYDELEDMNLEAKEQRRNRVPIGKIEAVKAGECSGAIDAIFMLRRALDQSIRFCPPPRVAPGQKVRIVAKYLDDHPEQMNDDFTLLVVRAFYQVWPCPNAN